VNQTLLQQRQNRKQQGGDAGSENNEDEHEGSEIITLRLSEWIGLKDTGKTRDITRIAYVISFVSLQYCELYDKFRSLTPYVHIVYQHHPNRFAYS